MYNWVKYKTLPPSFLFKNRLFVERDSKHRRVLSNFGLTFRNSKWSSYSMTNINLKFKNNYANFLWFSALVLIFLGALYGFNQYYINSFFFNNLIFIFWISFDSLDYYLSFVIWFTSILLIFFSNLLYSYFFFNNFSFLQKKQNFGLNVKNLSSEVNAAAPIFVSKHDLNWVLYLWLTRSKSADSFFIEKLFENNYSQWSKTYDFFIKLYRVVYFSNLLNPVYSSFGLKRVVNASFNNNSSFDTTLAYFNNSNLINSFTGLILNYYLRLSKSYFNFKNNNFRNNTYINSRLNWNLYHIDAENSKSSFLVKSKIGFFYNFLNYETYNTLFFNYSELWGLNFFLKNQVVSAKWTRWLYRYSILHRKSLKNAHKLTIAKRLVGTGFYDNNFFSRSAQNSEHFLKFLGQSDVSNFFSTFYTNLYGVNLNQLDNTSSNSVGYSINQKLILQNLSSIENSFFFVLKRFYLYNNLASNFVKSSYFPQNESTAANLRTLLVFKNNLANKNFFLLSYLLQNKSLVQNTLSIDFFPLSFNESVAANWIEFPMVKDVLVFSAEEDLLSKANLNALENITLIDNSGIYLILPEYSFSPNIFTRKLIRNKFKRNSSSILNDFKLNNFLSNSMFFENTFLCDLFAFSKLFR